MMPFKVAFMLSQSIIHSEIMPLFQIPGASEVHDIIIGSFLYSNFHLLDRIHVIGKLLGVGENVTDLDSEEHLMHNITVSVHGSTLVSTMNMYIMCMVHGGSLLNIWCILLKMQLNNCHLPNTYL